MLAAWLSRRRNAFTLLLISSKLGTTGAFWRLPCNNHFLVTERVDPLTNPGTVSQHVHTISGGANFNLDMSFQDARNGPCTSCMVRQDVSNWSPTLYFAWANGSFSSVDQTGLLVYYLQRFNDKDTTKINAFPDGMRILAGNPYTRWYNGTSDMAKAIGWNCLGGDKHGLKGTRNPWLPTVNCDDGLRGEIFFPSCWNGKDVDSAGHSSHVAYPIGGESGPCPPTHPVRMISIFYEVTWSVDPWKDHWKDAKNTSSPFVLSTGDTTGYGYHGDFLNGWDHTVLQNAVDQCTAASGDIAECLLFDMYKYDSKTDGLCNMTTSHINEKTQGLLAKLPGCNPLSGESMSLVSPCLETNPPSTTPASLW